MGHKSQELPVESMNNTKLRLAELPCAPGDRVEHRLDVGRRTRDHAKNFARRLLLERLTQSGARGTSRSACEGRAALPAELHRWGILVLAGGTVHAGASLAGA